MDSQSTTVSVPSVSLVVSAVSADSSALESLASNIGRLGLESTWVVDQPQMAKVLAKRIAGCQFAAAVTARSPQRLRSELANLQIAVQAISQTDVVVVAGDPEQLRSRAAMLADSGIKAVVPLTLESSAAKSPRQLPCGLWQLDPTVAFPMVRSRWSLLPARRPSLKDLLAGGSVCTAAIDLGQVSGRDVHSFSQLIEEIAFAKRELQLEVFAIGQQASALANRHEVKPQRSILRRAA
ncbi:MAG: hypothetical protein AAGD11_00380 [Planctomycetota bacterium]